VTEEKVKSGVVSADGRLDGIMAPAGTWWRTRFPGGNVSQVSVDSTDVVGVPFSWWKRV
jgi:hypothetical protein